MNRKLSPSHAEEGKSRGEIGCDSIKSNGRVRGLVMAPSLRRCAGFLRASVEAISLALLFLFASRAAADIIRWQDLKHPLERGKTVKVTLKLDNAGTVDVEYPVLAIGAPAPGAAAGV